MIWVVLYLIIGIIFGLAYSLHEYITEGNPEPNTLRKRATNAYFKDFIIRIILWPGISLILLYDVISPSKIYIKFLSWLSKKLMNLLNK